MACLNRPARARAAQGSGRRWVRGMHAPTRLVRDAHSGVVCVVPACACECDGRECGAQVSSVVAKQKRATGTADEHKVYARNSYHMVQL